MSDPTQAFVVVKVHQGDTLAKITKRLLPRSSKSAQASAIRGFFRKQGVGAAAKYIAVSNPNQIEKGEILYFKGPTNQTVSAAGRTKIPKLPGVSAHGVKNENGVSLDPKRGEVARIVSDLEASEAMLRQVLGILGKVKKTSKVEGALYNAVFVALLTTDGKGESTRELKELGEGDLGLLIFDVLQAAYKSLEQARKELVEVRKGASTGKVLKQDGPALNVNNDTNQPVIACASTYNSSGTTAKWITVQPEFFFGEKPKQQDEERALTLIHEVIHLAGGSHRADSDSAFARAAGADTLERFVAELMGVGLKKK